LAAVDRLAGLAALVGRQCPEFLELPGQGTLLAEKANPDIVQGPLVGCIGHQAERLVQQGLR
jgi:hypothetical protein